MKKFLFGPVFSIGVLILAMYFCISVENVSAQEEDYYYVKLNQHVGDEMDVLSGWLDTIRNNPDSADRIKIAENAVNLDWEIIYVLDPGLQSDLLIYRERFWVHEWLTTDSTSDTAQDVEVHIYFESEDGSIEWYHHSETQDVGYAPTHFSTDFRVNSLDMITPEENFRLRINVKYSGIPRPLYLLNRDDNPSGILIPVKNPMDIEINSNIDQANEEATITSTVTSPLGDYHIDKSTYIIEWEGPTTPVSVTKNGESEWVWNYGTDGAESGGYTVTISVSDITQNPDANTMSEDFFFVISEDSNIGDNDDSADDDTDNNSKSIPDSVFIIGFVFLVIIIALIIVIFLWRKKDTE